jgi:hypothetical protein
MQKGKSVSHLDVELRDCVICGTASHPFGYVNKGKNQVCSKACDEEYDANRFKQWTYPLKQVA